MKIGLLGGTFDPIHFGHIKPLLEVKEKLHLDQVWLMPNGIPPHKPQPQIALHHRLEMIRQICLEYPKIGLYDVELHQKGLSYSVTTLKKLKTRHRHDHLFFIMGMDSFASLPEWHQWQQLFDLCHLIIYRRPGWTLKNSPQMQQLLEQRSADLAQLDNAIANRQYSGLILPVDINPQPYSSTEIRTQLTSHQLQHDALPKSVIAYIEQHGLYQ